MGTLIRGPWSPMIYNLPVALLARAEDVSVRTVQRWANEQECPHQVRDDRMYFCLARVREWRTDQERKAS